MKVYVVIEAHWPDDWSVVAVFDSKEKAEAVLLRDGDNDAAGDGNWSVEEFDLQ